MRKNPLKNRAHKRLPENGRISKKAGNFIKLAVKYYSKDASLPDGLIRESLKKIFEKKQD
jgi:hypothetical protein